MKELLCGKKIFMECTFTGENILWVKWFLKYDSEISYWKKLLQTNCYAI